MGNELLMSSVLKSRTSCASRCRVTSPAHPTTSRIYPKPLSLVFRIAAGLSPACLEGVIVVAVAVCMCVGGVRAGDVIESLGTKSRN